MPFGLFPDLTLPTGPWFWEESFRERGYRLVAGVDEVGRGPLAGPVMAAAVILDERFDYPGVGDSKKIDPPERLRAFNLILRRAKAIGLGLIGPEQIDRTDILRASWAAMAQAVKSLNPPPDVLLVDGPFPLPLDLPQKPLIRGDALSLSIGAASIVAKVIRDRLMIAYDRRYPGYGFADHKGYGTKAHRQALARQGPCPVHRFSFKGVKPG